MKWFGKWMLKVLQKANEDERVYATVATPKLRSGGDIDADDGLNITVRNALGGKIVSFRHYDHKTDRSYTKLYVIPDDLDFEKELGKMITLESMR